MAYADVTYYERSFGGALIPAADFPALERRAALYLDKITYNRLHLDWTVTDAVSMATCAIAEAIYQNSAAEQLVASSVAAQSENNDGYSVTYLDPAKMRGALEAALTGAARPYLIYTGLMDRSAQ